MKEFRYTLILLFVLFVSCISNDIPYPYIEGVIQEIEVEAQVGEAEIDRTKRIVTITIDERAEIDEVKILKLITNEESILVPDAEATLKPTAFPDKSFKSLAELPGNANTTVNFTKDYKLLLQTYQDYEWTIRVTQKINRVVTIEGQTGEALFDEENKAVLIYVPEDYDLTKIKFLVFEVEGKDCVSDPDPMKGLMNFTRSHDFSIHRRGKFIARWNVRVIHSQLVATVGEVDTWARRATVNGGMMSGATPVVEYKKASDSEWSTLPQSAVSVLSSTTFKASLNKLTDGTSYEWRVNIGGKFSEVGNFTTEKIEVIPNLNFDNWTYGTRGNRLRKTWYPNDVTEHSYWATGNEGVSAVNKDPISIPVEGADAVKGKAAKLTTITGITVAKAAAGNLYIGDFETNMSAPSTSPKFGRAFSGARPDKLIGYYKYTPAAINHPVGNANRFPPTEMSMDQGHIYIRIWDANDNLFAEGEEVISAKVDAYKKFSIDIKYKNDKARPAKITIVATSSRYGGEFEPGTPGVWGQVGAGSTLYVDEFELIYE